MSKVVLKGYIIVPTEDLPAIKEELPNHQNLTRDEEGSLVFQVTQSKTNPNRFDVYEEFIDRTAFHTHQVRVKNSTWGNVSMNIERHYEIFE